LNETSDGSQVMEIRSFSTSALVPPRCETCGGAMKLQRSEPHFGPHPELLSFRCQQCGHVITLVAEDER
jgi:predicted nucleic acid-binding Zn ribbon protein